jgi:2-dehydro-3-deoxygluconokinase
MEQYAEVITLGECMTLIYPDNPISLIEAKSLKMDIAGAESNLSIALSRLGHKVRFISRIGDDPFGEKILSILKREGVIIDSLIKDKAHPTGLFFREWLPDGQRRVYYYRKDSAASNLSIKDIGPELFVNARLLHLTGITPALSESCLNACKQAISIAKKMGITISFDPNYRPKLWDKQKARSAILPLIKSSDIVLMGHEDGAALFGQLDDYQYLEKTHNLGVKINILKRAERGALALINNELIEIPSFRVNHVKDPVGAGDGFDAGYLSGWLKGWEHHQSLKLGARIGAMAVQTEGDYEGYPTI